MHERGSLSLPPVLIDRAGVVTTLVTEAELPRLQAMAAELGVALSLLPPLPPELPADPEADVEAARRGLEDLFNFY